MSLRYIKEGEFVSMGYQDVDYVGVVYGKKVNYKFCVYCWRKFDKLEIKFIKGCVIVFN